MKIYYSVVFIIFSSILVGCQNDGNEKTDLDEPSSKKELIVREQSEMAALMLQMYAYNETLKEQIISNEEISDFPEQFMVIHDAQLTEGKVRGDGFLELTNNYLEAQRMIHHSDLGKKESFNKMVSSCVDCHRQKCTGPIPKIEKLYIKEDK